MRAEGRLSLGALLIVGLCCLAAACGGPALPEPLVPGVSPSAVPRPNLLESADFREDPAVWEGFREPASAPARLALDQAGFVSLTLEEVRDPVAAGWRQAVRVEGGESYRVSWRALAEGLAGYADLRLSFYDGNGQLLWQTGTAPLVGHSAWTACGARYRAPEGARHLLLSLGVERATSGRAAFAEPFLAHDDAPRARAVIVDYGAEVGPLRLQLGWSREPKGASGAGKALRGAHLVRIPLADVFPYPWADPDDPASYRFSALDAVLGRLREEGEVAVRLEGDGGWEAGAGTWAAVARRIVMHYNRGWAGGWRCGIRSWEVAGEGARGGAWCDVVAATVSALEEEDPGLEVGCLVPWPGPEAEAFVACLAERGIQPDLVFWRLDYDGGPFALASLEEALEAVLERHGLGDAAVQVHWSPPAGPEGDDGTYESADVAAAFAYAQDTRLTRAWLGWPGRSAERLLPERVARVLHLLEGFEETPRRLMVEGSDALGFAVLGARSEDGRLVRILVADTGSRSEEYRLGLAGFPPGFRYTVTEVSGLCAAEVVARGTEAGLADRMLRLPWHSPAVHLVEIAWD